MKPDFDKVIDRRGTAARKWDYLKEAFGPETPDDCLPLWVADMDFAVPAEVVEILAKRVEHGIFGYTGPQKDCLQVVHDYIDRHYHWDIQEEWVEFGPGVVPILSLAVEAFSKPGDKIMTVSPVYPPFFNVIKEQERELVAIPLKNDGLEVSMDFEAMEKAVDKACKVFLLCSPHNPCGRIWSKEELTQLGEFCCRHDLKLVSDEIHADFIYSGNSHYSIASLDENFADRSVTCYAPSKTFNVAGLSAAVAIIPNEEMRNEFKNLMRKRHLSVALFGYEGLRACWAHGDEWLKELLCYLEGNRNYLVEAIQKECPEIHCCAPQATYLLYLDCRELMKKKGLANSEELAHFMLTKARIALNNGRAYGPEGEGFMRLNFACPRSILEEAVKRLAEACR